MWGNRNVAQECLKGNQLSGTPGHEMTLVEYGLVNHCAYGSQT